MNTEKLNSWLSVLANVGVIGGLILVAVQLDQNYELLRLQMMDQESRRSTDHELVYVGEQGADVWAKVIENPKDLTLSEQRVAESLIWPVYESWKNAYRLHAAGLLQTEWQDRVVQEVPYYLDHRYGRAWWKNLKTQATTGEIPEDLLWLVDELLASSRDSHTTYHQNIMSYLDESSDEP